MSDHDPDDDVPRPGTGLCCCFHDLRKCGPDCMAYSDNVPEGIDYKTPDGRPRQWAFCMLLVNAHKVGKHVVLMANVMRVSADNQQRNQPMPPPIQLPLPVR